ncbi:MAG: papain-like cysteine protease family protein [Casimicrobiaceae bacterium]
MGVSAKPGDEPVVGPFEVPYVEQKRQQSCWYACAKMVYRYHHGADAKVKKAIVATEAGRAAHELMKKSRLIGEAEEGVGATEKDWPTVAAAFGLIPVAKTDVELLDQSFDGLSACLRINGPLWCAGHFFQGGSTGGHVIVVLGTMKRKFGGALQSCIVFHDPGPKSLQGGPFCVKQFDHYFKLSATGKKGIFSFKETEDVSPVMYMVKPAKAE